MAEFLSPGWVGELDAALQGAPLRVEGSDAALVFQLEVRDGDDRVRTHHIRVTAEGVHAVPGPADDPDLVLVTDQATAYALHRNECNAQAAIASGRLRIRGDLEAFSHHASTIASLGDLFASLRAATAEPAADDR